MIQQKYLLQFFHCILGVNQELCFEDTVILNLSGNANSYSWSNGIVNEYFSSNLIQDYILTGIDLNNCFNQDTVTITVNPLPNVEAGSNTSVCLKIIAVKCF